MLEKAMCTSVYIHTHKSKNNKNVATVALALYQVNIHTKTEFERYVQSIHISQRCTTRNNDHCGLYNLFLQYTGKKNPRDHGGNPTQKNAAKHLNQRAQGFMELPLSGLSLQACAQCLKDMCHPPLGQVPASRSILPPPSCKLPGSSAVKGSTDAKGSRHSLAPVDGAHAWHSAQWRGDT